MRNLVLGALAAFSIAAVPACGSDDAESGANGGGGGADGGDAAATGGTGGTGGTAGVGGTGASGGTAGSGGASGAAGSAGQAGQAGMAGQAGTAGAAGQAGAAGAAGQAGAGGAGGSAGADGGAGSGGTGGVVDAGWDATGSTNDCCGPAATPGCNDPAIEQCVCSKDGACCISAWDAICVNEVKTYNCGGCLCIDTCATAGAKKCSATNDAVEVCATGPQGCLGWQVDTSCATNETCSDPGTGPACAVPPPSGDNCSDPIPLSVGTNSVPWTGVTIDYLTTNPSCLLSSYSVQAPDIVLEYTATVTGVATVTFAKPTSTRWVAVVSDAACGTVTELACISDFSPDTMGGSFNVTQGAKYYIYVADTSSGTNPLDNPLGVTISEIIPPCTPGQNGIVGTTIGSVSGGGISQTEYYLRVDDNPTGYAYIGGTASLYRVPKAGGAAEDVEALAGLTTSNLGYDMLVVGSSIFTLESKTSGTTGHLWRISSDGGQTWNVQDFASFINTPNDDFRTLAHHGGKIYMATNESTSATEIWSVDVNATTLPAIAVLETTLSEAYVTALALDDTYYYVAAAGSDHVAKIHRTTGATTSLASFGTLSTSYASLQAHDTNNDGAADVLYFKDAGDETVHYICGLSTTPFGAVLVSWGTGTSDYGLGFDAVAAKLWSWDGTDFVTIQ